MFGKIGNDLPSPFQRRDCLLILLSSASQIGHTLLLCSKKTVLCEVCAIGTSVIGIDAPWFFYRCLRLMNGLNSKCVNYCDATYD